MSVWKKQVGGNHYTKYKMQPSKFVTENKLLYPEGSVIKYVVRHQDKGGKEDLEKAKHMIDMIIERDYKEDNNKETTQEEWIQGYHDWLRKRHKKERCPHN